MPKKKTDIVKAYAKGTILYCPNCNEIFYRDKDDVLVLCHKKSETCPLSEKRFASPTVELTEV